MAAMRAAPLLVGLVFLVHAGNPQDGYPGAAGHIFGHVVDQNNQPARGIGLEAEPLGVALGAVLPRATTDENGNYKLGAPWWGRYRVYAQDLQEGYAPFATPPSNPLHPAEVAISPDHPEAKFDFQLPPKGGILRFRVKDAKTGVPIHEIEVKVLLAEQPEEPVYSSDGPADNPYLVPSNKDILMHVTLRGYREWRESIGKGKALRLAPGTERTFDIALEPATK